MSVNINMSKKSKKQLTDEINDELHRIRKINGIDGRTINPYIKELNEAKQYTKNHGRLNKLLEKLKNTKESSNKKMDVEKQLKEVRKEKTIAKEIIKEKNIHMNLLNNSFYLFNMPNDYKRCMSALTGEPRMQSNIKPSKKRLFIFMILKF